MRRLTTLTLFLFHSNCFSQSCPPNIDFENGDFTGWQCFTGSTRLSAGQNIINLSPSPPTPNRHEIIPRASVPLLDQYGNFPRHCPYSGSNFSVQLGNNYSGGEAEGISYTFQIPPSADTFSVTYFYAVVFENPGHTSPEQPRFFVTAYDVVSGAIIDCASYNYVSTASIPGFQHNANDTSILYKDWTPASIDFSGLAGRQVRLEFKTADCTLQGHFGYAYIDVGTGCGGLITVAALCSSSNSVVLNAPYGFQNYRWFNSNYSTLVGSQQNVTIIPAPPANSLFHVEMVPYPGFGCRDTADAMVTALPVPDTPSVIPHYEYCQFEVAERLQATATSPNALLWYTAATGGIGTLQAPIPSTSTPGLFRYYVSQKVLFGCESERKEITVNVTPMPGTSFAINNTSQCHESNNFIFTNTSGNTLSSALYSWQFGDGNSATAVSTAHSYSNYGFYTVRLRIENTTACFKEITRQLEVIATPVADFILPSVACEQQAPVVITDNSRIPGGPGIINQWQWIIGTVASNSQHPVPFTGTGGNLPVKLIVRTREGCTSAEKSAILPIHFRPIAQFAFGNVKCENEAIKFKDNSILQSITPADQVTTWSWQIDDTTNVSQQNPVVNLSEGIHHVKFISESNFGCRSISIDTSFTIYGKPHVSLFINDSCINRIIRYEASSHGTHAVANWYWSLNNAPLKPGLNAFTQSYSRGKNNPVTLIGETARGCKDTVIRPFRIYENTAFAGSDTIAAMGQPVQLDAGGSDMLYYSWTPSTGLNNAGIRHPIATLDDDQWYELNSMSIYGCDAYSKVFIKRYKGPELFIPSAFTPNSDGLNDVLKVFPVGVKTFYSFAVYNRFGTRLFYTTNYLRGWDGTYRGAKLDPGAYVFQAKAEDYRGKIILKSGSVLLLR